MQVFIQKSSEPQKKTTKQQIFSNKNEKNYSFEFNHAYSIQMKHDVSFHTKIFYIIEEFVTRNSYLKTKGAYSNAAWLNFIVFFYLGSLLLWAKLQGLIFINRIECMPTFLALITKWSYKYMRNYFFIKYDQFIE